MVDILGSVSVHLKTVLLIVVRLVHIVVHPVVGVYSLPFVNEEPLVCVLRYNLTKTPAINRQASHHETPHKRGATFTPER